VYDASAALGPAIVLGPPPTAAAIELLIERGGETAYSGSTTTARLRRTFGELVAYLFRDNTFPVGCFLMTGAGVVPDDGFTLRDGDVVSITIEGVGTLRNRVVQATGSPAVD
jgi:2-dehydro-3-deoxy-D-arabinonate dehydratase